MCKKVVKGNGRESIRLSNSRTDIGKYHYNYKHKLYLRFDQSSGLALEGPVVLVSDPKKRYKSFDE